MPVIGECSKVSMLKSSAGITAGTRSKFGVQLSELRMLAGLAQAAGAFYLFDSPIKAEYNVYFGNGLNFAPATAGAPTLSELANLENMGSTFGTVSNSVTVGGRVVLWWPEKGLAAGVSALHNPDYTAGFNESLNVFAMDFNYHMGNWDFRAEYGLTNQQAQQMLVSDSPVAFLAQTVNWNLLKPYVRGITATSVDEWPGALFPAQIYIAPR